MSFHRKWILLTFAGWTLGTIAALLAAPLANSLSGKYLQQSPLAISMAIVIGILQSVLLKKYYPGSLKWFWIYFFSFTFCFTTIEFFADIKNIKPEIYLPLSTLIAGLCTGYLQAKLFFRLRGKESIKWTLQCGISWFATIIFVFLIAFIGDLFIRQVSEIINIVTILSGGLILGYLTKSVSKYVHEN